MDTQNMQARLQTPPQLPAVQPADAEAASHLIRILTGSWVAQIVHAAAKLDLAVELRDGPRDAGDVALAIGVKERPIYRLLRALAGIGVVQESEDGRFGLTSMGHLLRSDTPNSLHAFAVLCGEDWHWRSWGEIVDCVKNGGPVFDRLFGMPIFDYLGRTPEAGTIFDAAMTNITASWNPAIVAALDFPDHATIVDVGGGAGILLSAILDSHPHLDGVLFDLPEVVERARKEPYLAKAIGEGRCNLVAGSFFAEVTAKGDIHIMKFILHDWSDEEAIAILTNCRKALQPGDRLVLVEQVVIPGNDPQFATIADIEMLLLGTGRERTEKEFAGLFGESGFKLSRVVPTAAPVSIVEARAV